MRKLTTYISIMLVATILLNACKKDKQVLEHNYSISKMKMNYYGEILEYTVKYSKTDNIRIIEGKDSEKVKQLIEKYPTSVTLFDSKNEIHFFKDKEDFNYYTHIKNSLNLRVNSGTNIVSSLYPEQITDITFYLHTDQNTPLITTTINSETSPLQLFMNRQPCNDGTDNSCPTFASYRRGVKNSWVGASNNDEFSSIRVKNRFIFPGYGGATCVTLYEDVNFGGRAIAFYFITYTTNIAEDVDNLKDYKINSLLKKWNDRTSSYECFY